MGIEQSFKTRVEDFLAATGMAHSRLGILAVKDPNFLSDLREGRSPRADTIDAVDKFMGDYLRTEAKDNASLYTADELRRRDAFALALQARGTGEWIKSPWALRDVCNAAGAIARYIDHGRRAVPSHAFGPGDKTWEEIVGLLNAAHAECTDDEAGQLRKALVALIRSRSWVAEIVPEPKELEGETRLIVSGPTIVPHAAPLRPMPPPSDERPPDPAQPPAHPQRESSDAQRPDSLRTA